MDLLLPEITTGCLETVFLVLCKTMEVFSLREKERDECKKNISKIVI